MPRELGDPPGGAAVTSAHPVPDGAGVGSGRRRFRRPRTLRARLVLGIVVLIAAVCAVVGVATEIFLGSYLVAQLDGQVTRIHEPGGGPDPSSGRAGAPQAGWTCPDSVSSTAPASPPGFGFGQPSGALTAAVVAGRVVSAGIVTPTSAAGCTAIPAAADPALVAVPTDGRLSTVTIPGVGDYRVAADVRGGATVITGLPLSSVRDSLAQLALIMVVVAGIALLAGAAVVIWVVRGSLAPLDRVAATARRVSTLPLDHGEVRLGVRVPARDTDPRTEVGQVGAALNQMLGHVSSALAARQASETRVRRFVADASHELRTPLAAIRGYAELARREEHHPLGVAHALRQVESESARMTTLVDDLLLLARLDSGRPLATDPVDLTMLVIDAVSAARIVGPEHRWHLDLPDQPVTTTGDQARLRQVLDNLLANARTHTPAGTLVGCRLRAERDTAVLTVTDDGPGIPADLQPEIFHRFARGDSSRSRAAGSTGLGLAIADAVIAAHQGTVSVQSRPGQTGFTVRLPRAAAAETDGCSPPTG